MNSSQFKRKWKTIKLENIILTSLSTTISIHLFTDTLNRHEITTFVLQYCCQLCSSEEQIHVGEYLSLMVASMAWNSHLLLRLLSGVGGGGKESGGGNSARGALKIKITYSFFSFFNIQRIYFPSAAHKTAQ